LRSSFYWHCCYYFIQKNNKNCQKVNCCERKLKQVMDKWKEERRKKEERKQREREREKKNEEARNKKNMKE